LGSEDCTVLLLLTRGAEEATQQLELRGLQQQWLVGWLVNVTSFGNKKKEVINHFFNTN